MGSATPSWFNPIWLRRSWASISLGDGGVICSPPGQVALAIGHEVENILNLVYHPQHALLHRFGSEIGLEQRSGSGPARLEPHPGDGGVPQGTSHPDREEQGGYQNCEPAFLWCHDEFMPQVALA